MKISKILLVIILSFFLIGCSTKRNNNYIKENNNQIKKEENKVEKLKIVINNIEYDIDIEDNETTKAFIEMLPITINMNELNGNEKYAYLNQELPTNEKNYYINKGDIMLYQDNCLVIFYKSFNTSYNYTKIGHINNMGDLDKENITVTIKK